MKKLSFLLLAFLFIGVSTMTAQDAIKNETANKVESVEEVKKCAKTGKVCPKTCAKKKNGSCCQSKAGNSSCSKSKKGSFNFNKSNNYGGKSSCSSSKNKKCCKKKAMEKAMEKATEEATEEATDEE
ncbi:MAG: hypothetical protein CMD14_05245 [Flavobacteriales bacterium]|nr:hypothetical protein [Flavobacteriales bacterium]|tara:strand:+ start:28807 stop:29187 length:381 start_codon:yes stop_codon:yes gene_type:complete